MLKSRFTILVLLCLALVVAPCGKAFGEEPSGLQKGAIVKLTAAGDPEKRGISKVMKGTLVELDANTITLVPEKAVLPVTVDRNDLVRLEYQARSSRRGQSALIGLAAGAVTGGLLGFAGGDDPSGVIMSMTAGEKALAGGITLGLLGAGIGALIGPGAQWADVPDGGMSLGLGSMPGGESGVFFVSRF